MADPLIGRTFREYQVLARLGAGESTLVYRVKHRFLKTEKALKVVDPAFVEKMGTTDTFVENGKLVSGLRHKNLARVQEVGRTDDGTFYSLTELLDGETLRARLRRVGPLAVRDALKLLRDVAAGLAEVHEEGLLHRDVAPDNVMLAREKGVDVAKLIEFGLPFPMDGEAILRVTEAGLCAGRPRYAAPEQLGLATPLTGPDPRRDVYSLGLTLYEALTGVPVYEGEYTADVFRSRRNPLPPPPSVRARSSAIEPAIDDLVARMMDPDPASRPEDARAVLQSLDELLLGVRKPGAHGATRHEAPPRRPPEPVAPAPAPAPAAARGEAAREARHAVVRDEEPSTAAAGHEATRGQRPERERGSDASAEPSSASGFQRPGARESRASREIPREDGRADGERSVTGAPVLLEGRPFPVVPVAIGAGILLVVLLIAAVVSETLSSGTKVSSVPPAAEAAAASAAGPTLDAKLLDEAATSGDVARIWDWLRTFPQSGQRERAYRTLLNLGVAHAEICASVHAHDRALLERDSPIAHACR